MCVSRVCRKVYLELAFYGRDKQWSRLSYLELLPINTYYCIVDGDSTYVVSLRPLIYIFHEMVIIIKRLKTQIRISMPAFLVERMTAEHSSGQTQTRTIMWKIRNYKEPILNQFGIMNGLMKSFYWLEMIKSSTGRAEHFYLHRKCCTFLHNPY